MKIEIWSDFVCPFCYIGKRRLELALGQFSHKDQVTIEYKSFQLDPTAPTYTEKSIYEALAVKFGTTEDQVKTMNQGIIQQAAEIGLTYNYDDMKPTNTFDAHRLAKLAKSQGKEAAWTEKLMHSYFTDGKNIGDKDTLIDLTDQIGLDRTKALDVLNDVTAYKEDVKRDQVTAQQLGITGVPFFVINQKYAISGAQPLETFTGALQKVWEEEHPQPKLQPISFSDATGAVCTDESCLVPDANDK